MSSAENHSNLARWKKNKKQKKTKKKKKNTRASRWRTIAYPRALIYNITMFVQNGFLTRWAGALTTPPGVTSKFQMVPPVLIQRAITCDSFKVLAQNA